MKSIALNSVVTLLVIGLLVLSACSIAEPTATQAPQHVKIAYLPAVQSLPLFVAMEKGYFKDANIDVEAIKFDSPNLLIQTLVAGQADFGAAASTACGITAIADSAKPGVLKVFSVSSSGNAEGPVNEAFVVRSDSNATSIADLKGKKIGVLPSIQWRTILKDILAKNGLDSDKEVQVVELAGGLQVQALAANQVDALLAIEPVPTIAEVKGIGKELTHAPTEHYIADPFYPGCGSVRVAFAQENPALTKQVMEIFRDAMSDIKVDPEGSRQYFKNYLPMDDAVVAALPPLMFKMYDELTPTDVSKLQDFFDIFTKHGVIGDKIDAKGLLYTP